MNSGLPYQKIDNTRKRRGWYPFKLG